MIVPINLDAADRMLDEWLDADDQRRFATANWQLIRSNYAAILDAARAGVVTEVPEPSAEGPAFIAIMPPSPETSKRWYSMYCRECGVEEMMADTADDPRLVSRRDKHNRERHSAPQGEASDAQVDDAWWKAQEAGQLPRTPGPSNRQAFKVGYRAALRAAGGVR